jgi:hypothetical protein
MLKQAGITEEDLDDIPYGLDATPEYIGSTI